jgi:hypothetical protein
MTISLAFVAPALVKAALEGRLPRGIGVASLRDAPAQWSRQFERLGLAWPGYIADSTELNGTVVASAVHPKGHPAKLPDGPFAVGYQAEDSDAAGNDIALRPTEVCGWQRLARSGAGIFP